MREVLDYLKSLPPEGRADFAARCGTSLGYIRKAASVGHLFSPATCVRIEAESSGVITRPMLRPDDWHLIWPELADSKLNHPQATAHQARVAINSESRQVAQGVV